MKGIVYTETLIHAAPQAFVAEAPYQLIIVTLQDGSRITGRVSGGPVKIDDPVELDEERDGVHFFKKL